MTRAMSCLCFWFHDIGKGKTVNDKGKGKAVAVKPDRRWLLQRGSFMADARRQEQPLLFLGVGLPSGSWISSTTGEVHGRRSSSDVTRGGP